MGTQRFAEKPQRYTEKNEGIPQTSMSLWNRLSPPWQAAVALAWEAYCARSLPIGAVIVNGNGRLVANGRNALFESESDAPLHGSRLAHAEMNALLALSKTDSSPENCTLYTTLEPCMMCMGAIRMMRIGMVHFACHDPLAGSAALVETAPYQALGPLPVSGPQDATLEAVLLLLNVETMLRVEKAYWVEVVETACPREDVGAVPHFQPHITLGKQLFASGELWQLGQQKPPAAEMLDWLQSKLSG
ncbi:tRNA-specific adenosine-34 deaminase [hydrothermal vent metagenome]|uniref:tRNA-specific adenosine-34 deaminase n=1 Tax=hydrothermal vent metagenome TaxID=652676 RepID=A0A3B0VEB0_9ZZZZ